MALLSIIILTKDEALNLQTCLTSLQNLNAEVFIVDSGSQDTTLDVANRFGCKIYTHSWINHAEQINWALQTLPITTLWTMRLDADERLTPELVRELNQQLSKSHQSVSGYLVKRRVFFMGRWIRHGGYYPTWLMRIWRTGLGVCEQRWMDEHIVLKSGDIRKLDNDIIDDNQKDLTFWIDKHNSYADREVKDLLRLNLDQNHDKLLQSQYSSQASQRRWVKKNLYGRSPLFLRAFIYWLLRYTIGLGFLDGIEGLIFHFLQGFWYRFLVDAKIYEIRRKRR